MPEPLTNEGLWEKGLALLESQLGPVQTLRFMAMISRQTFDYQRWRRAVRCAEHQRDSCANKSQRGVDRQRSVAMREPLKDEGSCRKSEGEEGKLAMLRLLAAEGFHELDRDRGTEINGRKQLRTFIGKIGRRAAKKIGAASP